MGARVHRIYRWHHFYPSFAKSCSQCCPYNSREGGLGKIHVSDVTDPAFRQRTSQ